MKKTFYKLFMASLVLFAIGLTSQSCTKNYYDYGVEIDPHYYQVLSTDFKWDEDLRRWYYSEADSWLTKYQVEEMEIAGTVVFGTGTNSFFCPMPFIDSYYYNDNYSELIVETIGYEVTYGKVTFYIQTSNKDVTRAEMLKQKEYEFKISLFYRIN